MEISSYHYYSALNESLQESPISSPDLPSALRCIGREELAHKKSLERILQEMENWRGEGILPREHKLYWKALAFRHVMNDKKVPVASAKDILSGLLCFEQDTILFFLQLKKFLPEKEAKIINGIIEEEKKHLKTIASFSCS